MNRFCPIVAMLLVLATPVWAAVIRVPDDASSIQDAVNSAMDGDVVVVARGDYAGALIDGKNIAVIAEDGPCNTRIVAPSSQNDGFAVWNCTGTEIRGFRIIDMPRYGIQIRNTTGAWIHENVVHGSASSGIDVPGVYPNFDMLIEHNTVVGNTYGILADGNPSGVIRNNVVWGNDRSEIGCFFDTTTVQVACNVVEEGGICITGDNTVVASDPFVVLADFADLQLRPDVTTPAECGFIGAPLACSPPVFSINGTLFSSCGGALAGVTVDLFNQDAMLLESADSDATGAYGFADIPGGAEYTLQVVTPLGYLGVPGVTFTLDDDHVQDFTLQCIEVVEDARSVGFWKHNVGLAVAGRTQGAQESAADLISYAEHIFDHFYENGSNPIDVLDVSFISGPFPLDLQTMKNTLIVTGNVPMLERAKQQFLALLLNTASGRLHTYSEVSDDGRTCSQAISYIEELIQDGDPGTDEQAKSIADTINNGQLVGAGEIPGATPDIAFKAGGQSPTVAHFLGVGPTPFNPMTTFRFDVSRASRITLRLVDVKGRTVRTLVDGVREPGLHRAVWDGTDDHGRNLPSGAYYAAFQAGGRMVWRGRVVLLK